MHCRYGITLALRDISGVAVEITAMLWPTWKD